MDQLSPHQVTPVLVASPTVVGVPGASVIKGLSLPTLRGPDETGLTPFERETDFLLSQDEATRVKHVVRDAKWCRVEP